MTRHSLHHDRTEGEVPETQALEHAGWWRRLFSVEEMTESVDSNQNGRPRHRLSGPAIKAARKAAISQTAAPTCYFRRGEREGRGEAAGSGILIGDGTNFGILTAGHVLDAAAKIRNDGGPPTWACISQRPPLGGPDEGVIGGIAVALPEQRFVTPNSNHGRTDIGVGRLNPTVAAEACEELGVAPLDVRSATQHLAEDPLRDVHVAIGCPADMQDGGHPFVNYEYIPACRTYRAGGFDYIGYGVNGPNEDKNRRDRNWSGFSGGAVWSTRAKPGTLDKLSRDHGISVDDFEPPRLVAMLCYQNRGNWRGNIGAPKGFTEELYAHRIDEQVLKIVGFFLEAENPPGVEAGLIVETSANRP